MSESTGVKLNRLPRLAGIVLLLAAARAAAHPGGLDGHGCHAGPESGDYHCHEGVFNDHHFRSREAMLAELERFQRAPAARGASLARGYYEDLAGRCDKVRRTEEARRCCVASVSMMKMYRAKALPEDEDGGPAAEPGCETDSARCEGSYLWCRLALPAARESPYTRSTFQRGFRKPKPKPKPRQAPAGPRCLKPEDCVPCGSGCIHAQLAPLARCKQPTHDSCGCVRGECRKE